MPKIKRLSIGRIAKDDTKQRRKAYGLRKRKTRSGYRPDPADLAKGQLVIDVTMSSDPIQAVTDRMCVWPDGNEIISLLMVLKSEQMNESWLPTAKPPSRSVSSVSSAVSEQDPKMTRRN